MAAIQVPDELAGSFSGELLAPDSPGYDAARRVHNGLIDKHPGLVARCSNTADVRDAVNLGREAGVEISVRGGGHNVAGLAATEGGLMIDLAPMRGIHVDPAARRVRAQPGVTWNEYNRAANVHGLATTGGVISTTGDRRADTRRRFGLADGQVRHGHRQPRVGRGGPCRREGRHCRRRRRRGLVVGASRWGWQLRRRHFVRVPRAPGRHGLRRDRRASACSGRRSPRLLSPVHQEPPRRTHRVRRTRPCAGWQRHEDRCAPGVPLRRSATGPSPT